MVPSVFRYPVSGYLGRFAVALEAFQGTSAVCVCVAGSLARPAHVAAAAPASPLSSTTPGSSRSSFKRWRSGSKTSKGRAARRRPRWQFARSAGMSDRRLRWSSTRQSCRCTHQSARGNQGPAPKHRCALAVFLIEPVNRQRAERQRYQQLSAQQRWKPRWSTRHQRLTAEL